MFRPFKASQNYDQPNPDQSSFDQPSLYGSLGELVVVRLSVDPRHLEDLLEALAALDFPVNPELIHSHGSVAVEFPAYSKHIPHVRAMLDTYAFDPELQLFGVLENRHAPSLAIGQVNVA